MLPAERSFTASLYRPYLDLGPIGEGDSLSTWAAELAYRALVEERDGPWIHREPPPAFRERLIAITGLTAYRVRDPRELPAALRTDRWQHLCEYLDSYDQLTPRTQFRVVRLLGKLGLYEAALERMPEFDAGAIGSDELAADIAFLRALARYVLADDGITSPSLADFERVATHAPPGSLARIRALNAIVAQQAKRASSLEALQRWLPLHGAEVEIARPTLDAATYTFHLSRHHRAAAFIPQLQGDRAGVVREMDRCQQLAERLPRETFEQRIVADELLFPTLESRIKESLWLGDLAMAEQRARRLVALNPVEPRSFTYLGQVLVEQNKIAEALDAYLRVARLGAPEAEAAWFMAGQCHEALGRPERACAAYLAALKLDPLGIAAVERLTVVAEAVGDTVLAMWSRTRRVELQARQMIDARGQNLAAYQSYTGRLGGDGASPAIATR